MDPEYKRLEKALEELSVNKMPEDMLQRMDDAMTNCYLVTTAETQDFHAEQDSELENLEKVLNGLSAQPLPSDMLQRLDTAMSNWQSAESTEIEEDKIVPFTNSQKEKESWWSKRMVSSAAAVALLGGVTAIIGMQGGSNSPQAQPVATMASPSLVPVPATNTPLVGLSNSRVVTPSASASRNIKNAIDQGIVYSKDNKPHRCMKVEYFEEFNLRNEKGQQIILEKPAFEYLLVPLPQN